MLKASSPNLKIKGFYTRKQIHPFLFLFLFHRFFYRCSVFTGEIRQGSQRVGFEVVTLDGRTAPLASTSVSRCSPLYLSHPLTSVGSLGSSILDFECFILFQFCGSFESFCSRQCSNLLVICLIYNAITCNSLCSISHLNCNATGIHSKFSMILILQLRS